MALRTPLYDEHVRLGAKLCDFAGYDMPLYYPGGAIGEHMAVREGCGMFDVSHMGQIILEGEGAARFWEAVTPSVFASLAAGRARYTVLTNDDGGIIDDLIITRLSERRFFAVVNAGCKHKDIERLRALLPAGVALTELPDRALIALQGSRSEAILRSALAIDASALGYMRLMELDGIYVSRLGYTGEDGFEISLPSDKAAEAWRALEDAGAVPAGLAARDSLRLEMGYPLYGHDIDAGTSPLEADLAWVIGKNATGYAGAEAIEAQRIHRCKRKRVGIKLAGKTIAREGAAITDANGNIIGALTSGGFSPVLQCGIGQGYVAAGFAAPGTDIYVIVRDKQTPAVISAPAHLAARIKKY